MKYIILIFLILLLACEDSITSDVAAIDEENLIEEETAEEEDISFSPEETELLGNWAAFGIVNEKPYVIYSELTVEKLFIDEGYLDGVKLFEESGTWSLENGLFKAQTTNCKMLENYVAGNDFIDVTWSSYCDKGEYFDYYELIGDTLFLSQRPDATGAVDTLAFIKQ